MALPDSSKAHLALLLVQLAYAGHHVISKLALSEGINQLVFCILRDLIALSVLAPLAYLKEKRIRPPMTYQLLFSLIFLGFTGIFANQILFLVGLSMTSPAFAAGMQPGIPVFTFMLALCMGTEHIDWNSWSGMAKIGGAITCILGAIVMAVYKGAFIWGDGFIDMHMQGAVIAKPSPEPVGWLAQGLIYVGLDTWHIGALCLIGNCFCMAIYIAFQASLLARYPAGLSVTAYSYLFGGAFMCVVGSFVATDSSDWALTRSEIFAVFYAGFVASALNYGLLTWSNKIVGPSLVALYMPLQPLFSSVLARVFLNTSLYLGSVLGGALIIFGLYCVTWGKMRSEGLLYRRNIDSNGHDPFGVQDRHVRNYSHTTGSIMTLFRVKTDKL